LITKLHKYCHVIIPSIFNIPLVPIYHLTPTLNNTSVTGNNFIHFIILTYL